MRPCRAWLSFVFIHRLADLRMNIVDPLMIPVLRHSVKCFISSSVPCRKALRNHDFGLVSRVFSIVLVWLPLLYCFWFFD